VAFPETILPLQVDLSLDGSTWTDVSSDVRGEQQIRITRGRSDWGQRVDAGRCSFVLSNTDGTYSPRNPEGTHFGQIGRNTPCRVSVNTGSVALSLPGDSGDYISTPDDASLDITGDIDIRFDATLNNWILPDYPSEGGVDFDRTELVGKGSSGQVSWILYIRLSRPYLIWSEDGSALRFATPTDLPLTSSGRLAIRATLDVDNGASGHDIIFYTADSIDGPWIQLGDVITGSGTTSIHSGTADLRIGSIPDFGFDEAIGRVHAVQVLSGIDGTAVANPDFTAQSDGATSFNDAAGLTWTVAGNAEITNRKVRFLGEIASWTPRWETGGLDVVTEVEAAGVLRRLSQGAVPLKSPMYRELTDPGRSSRIAGYWPMEDGEDATVLGSAIDGHPSFVITGTVTPAAYGDWVGSDALPTVGTGSMKVSIPSFSLNATNPANHLFFFAKVPSAGVVSTQRLVSLSTTGAARTWSLFVNTSGNLDLRAFDAEGTQLHASGFGSDSINGLEKVVILRLVTDGADVDYLVTVVDVADSLPTAVPDDSTTVFTFSGTVSSTTMGIASAIRFGEDGAMNDTVIGQVTMGNSTQSFTGTAAPIVGWNAEEAASRISRLGDEEEIHSYSTGPGDEQAGPQARGTAADLMQTAAEVDGGILAEQRDLLGVRYVTRASLYNQPAALTLDYTGADGLVTPLDPVDDDQNVTNDVTVQRTDGAIARVTLDSGALSTQPPPDGIGLYDTAHTLNLLDDEQPLNHAGWRLHVGTWDETRFPQVTVNLAAAPASIEAAAAVDVGSRIQITNPPVWLPPDTLDLLVQGYSEVMDQYRWTITYNCTPAGPFDVAWAGDDDTVEQELEFSWADTEGAELAEALSTTETDVDVLTTSGPTWTDDVGDTPYDLRVGGEVMTVTAPGGLLNENPFFDTDTTDWSGNNTTIARSTAQVLPHPRAVASLLITPNGSSATGDARCTQTAVGSIQPGASYTASLWAYSPGGWDELQPAVNWHESDGTYISTSSTGGGFAVAAGVWTYLEATFTAPATSSRAVMLALHSDTPDAADTWHVWGARVTHATASAVHDSFTRSETNSWGTADSGQTWTNTGTAAGNFDVDGAEGTHTLTAVNSAHRSSVPAPSADFDIYVDIATDALAAGGALYAGPMARYTDVNNLYVARLAFSTTQTVTLVIFKRVAAAQTNLVSFTTRLTHVAGTFVRVRFQGFGTALKAKVWEASELEPGPWQAEVTDSSLTGAASLGCWSLADAANTNTNPVVSFDNFDLATPQTYTVTRSQNGVVKTHSADTDVVLAYPAYVGL
jgi:hypothetical protein